MNALIKRITLALLGFGSCMAPLIAQASQYGGPQWFLGDMNCKIDGRNARMNWRVINDPQTVCEGNVCSSTSGVKLMGQFSDNGGAWVPLSRVANVNNNILGIRYLGNEPDNWQLTFNPYTEFASGFTTWRGNRYPLSCWKGAVPLTERCDAYATQAVQQFQSAQQQSCNLPADARWQGNRNNHYSWCMNIKGKPEWLEAESKARNLALATCRRVGTSIPSRIRLPIERISQ